MDDEPRKVSPVEEALMLLTDLTEQLMCQADRIEQFAEKEEGRRESGR